MEQILDKILEYKIQLRSREKNNDVAAVSREEFTLLLSGVASFRKIPGIAAHMGFSQLYHCDNPEDTKLVKQHLKDLFDIEDTDSLLRVCYTTYCGSGEYEHFMTFWNSAPMFDISQLEPQGVKAFEMCKEIAGYFYPILQEKGFYAWDINERIALCRVAVACGIISDEEFYEITDEWVRLAQVFYHSYEEYAISCLCGAMYHMGRSGDRDLDDFLDLNIQILDLLLDNDGPWQTSQWYKPEEREWTILINNNLGSLGCMITTKALEEEQIGYMYHSEPEPDCPDSGWRFMFGDEDEEYLENADNTRIVTLNTVCNLQPDILAYIYAEVGRGFERNEFEWREEDE